MIIINKILLLDNYFKCKNLKNPLPISIIFYTTHKCTQFDELTTLLLTADLLYVYNHIFFSMYNIIM